MRRVLAHLDRMQHSIHQYQQGIQIEVAGQPSQPFYVQYDRLKPLEKGFHEVSMVSIDTGLLPTPEFGPGSMSCFFAVAGSQGRGDRVRHPHDVRSLVLGGSIWLSIGEDASIGRTYHQGEALFIPRDILHSWHTSEGFLSFSSLSPAVGKEATPSTPSS